MKLIGDRYRSTVVLLLLLIAVAYFAEWTDDFYGHCLTEGRHEPISTLQRSGHGGADPNFMTRMQFLAVPRSPGNDDSMTSTEHDDLDQPDNDTVLSKFGDYDRSTGIKVGNEYQSSFGSSGTSQLQESTGFGRTLGPKSRSTSSPYGKSFGVGPQF